MVEAYWEVGRVIVEEEQAGKGRAEYGKRIVEGLSERLQSEFGKGFGRSNLFHNADSRIMPTETLVLWFFGLFPGSLESPPREDDAA